MSSRFAGYARLMAGALLGATTALSIFYLTGLITTIGSSLEIPFILSGFLIGSVLLPFLGQQIFSRSRLLVAVSFLSIPAVFSAIFLFVSSTKIVSNYEMLALSFLAVGGNIFTSSLYTSGREGTFVSAIGLGLASLFVMTVMLIIYAALFDSYMPLIILAFGMLLLLLLPVVHFTSSGRGVKE